MQSLWPIEAEEYSFLKKGKTEKKSAFCVQQEFAGNTRQFSFYVHGSSVKGFKLDVCYEKPNAASMT